MKRYFCLMLLGLIVMTLSAQQISTFLEKPELRVDFKKFPLVTIASTHYLKEAPMVATVNPPVPVAPETFFRIIKDMGSYLYIELATGATGYMPNDPANRQKSFMVKGWVVHKPWTKSMESWLAGGSDYYLLEKARAAGGIALPEPLFLRLSKSVSFARFKKFTGKKVKIVAILDIPKVESKPQPVSQRPIEQPIMQRPVMQRPVGRLGEVPEAGSGKGIRVLFIGHIRYEEKSRHDR